MNSTRSHHEVIIVLTFDINFEHKIAIQLVQCSVHQDVFSHFLVFVHPWCVHVAISAGGGLGGFRLPTSAVSLDITITIDIDIDIDGYRWIPIQIQMQIDGWM